jgi:hypothetical protein
MELHLGGGTVKHAIESALAMQQSAKRIMQPWQNNA